MLWRTLILRSIKCNYFWPSIKTAVSYHSIKWNKKQFNCFSRTLCSYIIVSFQISWENLLISLRLLLYNPMRFLFYQGKGSYWCIMYFDYPIVNGERLFIDCNLRPVKLICILIFGYLQFLLIYTCASSSSSSMKFNGEGSWRVRVPSLILCLIIISLRISYIKIKLTFYGDL